MSRPTWIKTDALVLKAIPLAEADRLLFLYTPDLGKTRAVAKGVRRIRSKLAGHVEPLVRTSLALTPGKNLYTVTEAQVQESFVTLRSNLITTSQAIYLAELLNGFGAENVGYRELYQLFLQGFRFLDQNSICELALRYLEIHLLRISGFLPELYFCTECRIPIAANQHRYAPDIGGVLCSQCMPPRIKIYDLSLSCLKVMRHLLQGSLDGVRHIKVPSNVMAELRQLLRASIRAELEYEPKSVKFLDLVTVLPDLT